MKRSIQYMSVAAAAVMVMGSFSIACAENEKCPNCGYLLTGSTLPNGPGSTSPGTTNGPSSPNSPANNTTTTAKKGWVQVTENRQTVWKYYNDNGVMIKSQWFQSPSSGLWYYFDRNGNMVTGWGDEREIEGYWFDSSGAMATGWRTIPIEEEEYTYGPGSGSTETGYFYFGGDGKVCEGWTRIGESWYFLNNGYADGFVDYQMVYGEVDIDGEEYYFGASNDGSMKIGLVKVISESNANTPSSTKTESYYLYKDNGMRVREGWGRYNGVWYYIDSETGEVVTEDFVALDSYGTEADVNDENVTIYYMDANGVMKTGWVEMGESTAVRPGVTKGKVTYYFNSNGTMATGWRRDGNKWYYLMPDNKETGYEKGQMFSSGTKDIEGYTYFFNTNGEMAVSTWKTVDVGATGTTENTCYFGEDGKMYKAASDDSYLIERIGNRYYVFNNQGARLVNTEVYNVDGKWTSNSTNAKDGCEMYTINRSGVASRKTYRKPTT